MGLQVHIDRIVHESGIDVEYNWFDGLNTNAEDALAIMKVLDDSHEFGPTRYNVDEERIEFGWVKALFSYEDYENYGTYEKYLELFQAFHVD